MTGRIQFDLLPVIKANFKLRSYTLNAVSAHFLGQQKEDVHHSIISDLWRESDDGRARLCSYCLKDALLPQRLMDKLSTLTQYIEMARVCGVPMSFLLNKGQQIKVMAQLLPKTAAEHFLVPFIPVKPSDDKYEGAIVIDPKRGFYSNPLATLDFSSLYPSIMMAHNLCYTTWTTEEYAETHLKSDDYTKTPAGFYFVKSHIRKGLLPCILESLLSARKKAKNDMEHAEKMAELEDDPVKAAAWKFRQSVQDGRQLALKISANSVYGFTGATIGKLPCIPISSSVTAFGRDMIELTREVVETKFTQAKIFKRYGMDVGGNAEIIYGDTDSVMINFHVETVGEAMDLGKKAAAIVNTHFQKPINLAFEKIYYPYLLINKKRYIGGFWTREDKMDKVDAKGVESVRRDNCQMVAETVKELSNILMFERNVDKAVQYTKDLISDLLQNKIDMSKLVITKAYSKKAEDYKAKQAHVELVKRIQQRTPDIAPQIGDRIPYVIVMNMKGAKTYEKVEDPLYVLKMDLPIDTTYYLENQLKKPLTRIFAPILCKLGESVEISEKRAVSLLFTGEHTRHITRTTPKTLGIAQFCVQVKTCQICKTRLGDESGICKNCVSENKAQPYLLAKVDEVKKIEKENEDLWDTCQKCQGSYENIILCTNRDCGIFYKRTIVKKKFKHEKDKLEQLCAKDLSW